MSARGGQFRRARIAFQALFRSVGSTVWLLLGAVVEISSWTASNRGIPMGYGEGATGDEYIVQGAAGVQLVPRPCSTITRQS